MFGAVLIQMAVVHELKDKLPQSVVSLVLSYWDAPHLSAVFQQMKCATPLRDVLRDYNYWDPTWGGWVLKSKHFLPLSTGWIRSNARLANTIFSSLTPSPWERDGSGKLVCNQSKNIKTSFDWSRHCTTEKLPLPKETEEKGISVLPVRLSKGIR